MLDKKIKIELSESFIKEFFEVAGVVIEGTPSSRGFENALKKIKNQLNPNKPEESAKIIKPVLKNILIIDDLSIVVKQLDMLLHKLGCTTISCDDSMDALEHFKKQDFSHVIMDLLMPTERAGLALLDEIKKLVLLCNLSTKIIVMTASDKKDLEKQCLHHGANIFFFKLPGWQTNIIDYCMKND